MENDNSFSNYTNMYNGFYVPTYYVYAYMMYKIQRENHN